MALLRDERCAMPVVERDARECFIYYQQRGVYALTYYGVTRQRQRFTRRLIFECFAETRVYADTRYAHAYTRHHII